MSDTDHRIGFQTAGGIKYREVDVVAQTVEQIMGDRQVSRSQAYKLRRQQIAAQFANRPASESLKEAILKALATGGRCDAKALAQRVQRAGYSEAEHGVVHVIWALQKDSLVAFRESKQHGLQNVHLTKAGERKASELLKRDSSPPPSTPPLPSSSPVKIFAEQKPAEVTQEPAEVPTSTAEVRIAPALFASRYPLIQRLRTRQSRIEAAAKTLEEEGLMDEAVRALEAMKYTDLEKEVIRLVDEELDL